MFGIVVLTIARIVLIGVVWLNWYLAKPVPFFIAFILTLAFLQQIAEHVSRRNLDGSGTRG